MEADNMQIDIVNKSVMCSTMQLLLQTAYHFIMSQKLSKEEYKKIHKKFQQLTQWNFGKVLSLLCAIQHFLRHLVLLAFQQQIVNLCEEKST